MNPGATSQRVYHDLKQRLLAGHFKPGERLEPAPLGEQLSSSATPVRDSLHLLAGEGLVETALSDGFHVARIDAPAIEDLYRWTAEVLGVVARSVVTFAAAPPGGDYPDAIARLFADFSIGSRNTEHARAVAALNDRLHAIRRAEAQLLPDWQEELAELSRHLGEGARAALAGIAGYHRRRIKLASEIVRYRYRLD
ncbi:MAG TPA: GntR family transcriptional regulator [Sphingomonas sp.]